MAKVGDNAMYTFRKTSAKSVMFVVAVSYTHLTLPTNREV